MLEYDTDYNYELILKQERENVATHYGSVSQAKWELAGGLTDNIESLLEIFARTSGTQLAIIPKLAIHGIDAVDLTGVFSDRANHVWDFLLHRSGIFAYDSTLQMFTFAEIDRIRTLEKTKRLYYVAGKMFRWFIFHHQIIPYPVEFDPSIPSFGICGYVPQSIVDIINPAVARVASMVESWNPYTEDSESEIITDEITTWLDQINMSEGEFLRNLHSGHDGPIRLAFKISTSAIVGLRANQFQWFHEGFNDGFEVESVHQFTTLKLTIASSICIFRYYA